MDYLIRLEIRETEGEANAERKWTEVDGVVLDGFDKVVGVNSWWMSSILEEKWDANVSQKSEEWR